MTDPRAQSAAPAPAPLTRPELERLWRWERHMIRYYAAAMAILLAAGVLAMAYSDVVWLRRGVLGLVVVLLLAATYVQFRERCPRCGMRIGSQSRLMLPNKCRRCGVAFDRPPKPGG